MPGSTASAQSFGSRSASQASTSASRRSKSRSYRPVRSTGSYVEEELFGTPHHVTKRNEMLEQKWKNQDGGGEEVVIERQASARNETKKKSGSRKKKETVQVITKDLIRNLVVPTEDPSGQSIILNSRDFMRIINASRVPTEAEREAASHRMKQEKEDAQDACTNRKNFMKSMDINRQRNEPLNELEEEAKERAQHLLARANAQRQEQEDEIKYLNELILNAKCHAIRDAQVLEKGQISKEMEDEEVRLDKMMEIDNENSIKIQEEIEKKRREERLLGAVKILDQIQENEQQRLYELEKKDQENIAIQKMIARNIEEDRSKIELKKHEQGILREELNKANADILERKEKAKDMERLIEAKVLEYQQQKAEREAAYEKEQENIRIEKEKEVARLRAMQERARDEQAERDALRAKRAQEQAEREWRRKEAEEARKKAETEEELKIARANQMEQKEHFHAVQAQRERAEFERVLKVQTELMEKERREKEEHAHKRVAYSEEVRQQIRVKEQQRIQERNAFFEEGVKLDEEARARRAKLDEIKKKKLLELQTAGIHDKYIAQVERKLNQPQHISA